jgi:beta-glucosidase/6-phospho-beta-glucosidase/beta-galactosidase
VYDFSPVDPMIDAMNKYGIIPIWDLCHYGYPDDLDPFSIEFVKRFVQYATAFSQYVSSRMQGPYFFTPINEITYFAFIGGLWGWAAPYKKSRLFYNELRLNLCRAAIESVKAIRKILPAARMIHADPLVQVATPVNMPQLRKKALYESNVDTYIAWDILCGKSHPELGGSPEILDIVGVNNYSRGFFEYVPGDKGPHKSMEENDKRVVPLCTLLGFVYKKYGRPIIIAETSSEDDQRAPWLKDVMEEILAAVNQGIDIQGICLFPAIGSPRWDEGPWVQSGFYNVVPNGKELQRRMDDPYVKELLRWQKILNCVTMLSDEPLNQIESVHEVKKAAEKLHPQPDRDWHR